MDYTKPSAESLLGVSASASSATPIPLRLFRNSGRLWLADTRPWYRRQFRRRELLDAASAREWIGAENTAAGYARYLLVSGVEDAR